VQDREQGVAQIPAGLLEVPLRPEGDQRLHVLPGEHDVLVVIAGEGPALPVRVEEVLAHLRAEEYLKTGPLGAGLAALMNRRKAGDPAVLRTDMERRVAASGLDEARKFLLLDVIATYFELSDDERERYETLISRKEYRTVLETKLTYSDRMREKFREEGLIEGKRDTLLRQLAAKFGPLSQETITKVTAVPSGAELDAHLERILSATALEEMGLSG